MDLYADLPQAKRSSASTASDGKPATSSVWATGLPGMAASGASKTNRSQPVVQTNHTTMLPNALAGARTKSPNGATAMAAKRGSPGISMAFRPASVTRKGVGNAARTASPSSSVFARSAAPTVANAFSAVSAASTAAPVIEATESQMEEVVDKPVSAGLGFVAATTWTSVKVVKESDEHSEVQGNDRTSVDAVMTDAQFFQTTYRDEYDPARPNSYEAFREERAAKQQLKQVKRDLEHRQRAHEKESKREREKLVRAVEEGTAPSIALPVSAGRGRGMTVPAWMRKKIEESASQTPALKPTASVISDAPQDQFEDATPRTGLGFSAQNGDQHQRDSITHAPMRIERDEFVREHSVRDSRGTNGRGDRGPESLSRVRKRSRSRSREENKRTRVNDSDRSLQNSRHNSESQSEHRQGRAGEDCQRSNPAAGRVVLLQNMVGPGEVDDDLQDEVKEECSTKYGSVVKCLIFERKGRVTPEQAVRIFVEFQREDDAAKAVAGLNGRFFGGRQVKATFYDEATFARLDLNA